MRRFDKDKNMLKANRLSEQRYLKSKGLISENKLMLEEPEFNDLNLNNIWNRLKVTLDDTSVNNNEKQRILNLINNGQKGYANLTQTQREQLYNKSVKHLENLEKQKTQTDDYLKQKQQQEKEGKEFETQTSPNGIKLFWDNIGNNYAIYFPINDVEKQRIEFGDDEKEFAQSVFNGILNYEKQNEYSKEEIYDIIDTLLPTLRRNFKK